MIVFRRALIFIGAFILFLTSSDAFAQKHTCDHVKKPALKVNINLEIPEATYDHTRSAKEMSDERFESTVEWLQKHGIKSVGMATHAAKNMSVRGLTSGGYSYQVQYYMHAKRVDRYGVYFCPYIVEIDIDFFYATKIFIASDIPKHSCEYEEVMEHEWKHHTANVLAVKTYSERLKQDLPKIVREIELRHGYVDRSKVERTYEDIQLAIRDMIEIYADSIMKENRRRNEAIDTPEEYERVDRAVELCEKEKS